MTDQATLIKLKRFVDVSEDVDKIVDIGRRCALSSKVDNNYKTSFLSHILQRLDRIAWDRGISLREVDWSWRVYGFDVVDNDTIAPAENRV